ncbi:cytochrome c oxidase assembly protein [Sphingomonas xinjiangensis]|uniref:Putative membrane protein n=1 Tax=Sphingomonas xinjiangensis TaxID=643568 RepID=A0A840YJ45_9SPHN|nr:cytochrome c oxidase assembly protein [Sphingomonas xinjiangensis]MBB5710958.1 putative membrane protein [Sphingomonas xinjiangensis]
MEPAIWTPYCGVAPGPGDLLARWNFDPLVLLTLAAATAAFLRWAPADTAQRRCFPAAMALCAVLFVSPLCAFTSALFSARVVHHLVLTAAVAPLLAWSWSGRAPGSLGTWVGLHAVIFWGWHSPPVYGWALSSDALYWLMQATLLGSAFALWSAVRRATIAGAIAALLGSMVLMGLLGALITFAGAPLYAPHLVAPIAWGFTPLEDQQLAGLIMWVPGGGIYLLAALGMAGQWFAREQALA